MNYFFALPLPFQVSGAVASMAADWSQTLPPDTQARWYTENDYHLTLKFLGDLDAERIPFLIRAAQPIAGQTVPFGVYLGPGGGFPDLHKPSVLWAGVKKSGSLRSLTSAIDHAVEEQGFVRDSCPYRPHITLARCRAIRRSQEISLPTGGEHVFPMWQADSFALMQTTSPQQRRNRAESRYNIVHLFPFGTTHSFAE